MEGNRKRKELKVIEGWKKNGDKSEKEKDSKKERKRVRQWKGNIEKEAKRSIFYTNSILLVRKNAERVKITSTTAPQKWK